VSLKSKKVSDKFTSARQFNKEFTERYSQRPAVGKTEDRRYALCSALINCPLPPANCRSGKIS
jgi:hypothetical protein